MTDETTDRNEERAEIQKKVTKKRAVKKAAPIKEANPTGYVYYVSSKPEPVPFYIKCAGQNIKGVFDRDKDFIAFRVPAELEERFVMHDFVVRGRLVKAED